MKILVLGSTGATGRLFTGLAVTGGHEVRALVRDPSKAELDPSVELVHGDARSSDDVSGAMRGVDLTVSALGMGLKTQPTGLMVDATAALITSAGVTGVDRLVLLSSWGVGETLKKSSLAVRLMYQAGKKVHNEKVRAEALLRPSAVNWTLVYPVALINAAPRGAVSALDLDDVRSIPGMPKISRADVAQYMLTIAEQDLWQRKTVVLGAPAAQLLR